MKIDEAKKRTKAQFVAAIDEAELAVRLIEAGGAIRRPPGKSARETLGEMDLEDQASALRMARAAMEYWRECIDAAQQPS